MQLFDTYVQKLKYMSIIPNVILIVFNIYSLTFASAALDFMEVIIIIVAIISYIVLSAVVAAINYMI